MHPTSSCLVFLCWMLAAAPAAGQDVDPAGLTIKDGLTIDLLANARRHYGIDGTVSELDCPPATRPDEVVVCARRRPLPRIERVPPPDRIDNMKQAALGAPPIPLRAPSLSIKGCFLQKCPRALYFIDFSTLPDAPEGSDADLIAKGEMRGR